MNTGTRNKHEHEKTSEKKTMQSQDAADMGFQLPGSTVPRSLPAQCASRKVIQVVLLEPDGLLLTALAVKTQILGRRGRREAQGSVG